MKKNDSYHHGSLRQALIDAAFAVVVEQGQEALSLRELAQTLNVSRGAPYRHFPDKDALLAAVATKGFVMLGELLEPLESRVSDPTFSVECVGQAFLNFAADYPRLYQVMFDSSLMERAESGSDFGEAVEKVYNRVSSLVKSLLQLEDEKQLKRQMVAMWSTLYGYAHLRHVQMLKPYMIEGISTEDIENTVLTTAFSYSTDEH